MKNLSKAICSKAVVPVIFLFTTLPLQAADVVSSFNDGDTLTATKMTEIKDAVNSKQNAVTDSCPSGESIGAISADGTVTCEAMPVSGVEGVTATSNVDITTTTGVSLATLTIAETGTFDVALNAHASIEIDGSSNLRFKLEIRESTCSGALLGEAMWRPGGSASDGTNLANTTALTGFQTDVTGPVTYVFCGRKYDGGFPDALVFYRGFNLSYSN